MRSFLRRASAPVEHDRVFPAALVHTDLWLGRHWYASGPEVLDVACGRVSSRAERLLSIDTLYPRSQRVVHTSIYEGTIIDDNAAAMSTD